MKKKRRRGEFHKVVEKNISNRKHACLTTYLRDKSKEFWICLVVVSVNIARRLAKKMYLKEEGTVDLDYVDRWLPRGTLFGRQCRM